MKKHSLQEIHLNKQANENKNPAEMSKTELLALQRKIQSRLRHNRRGRRSKHELDEHQDSIKIMLHHDFSFTEIHSYLKSQRVKSSRSTIYRYSVKNGLLREEQQDA